MTGTFGRIFHGVLLDEKDPSKEKQVFVKTVKGRRTHPRCNARLNAQLSKKFNILSSQVSSFPTSHFECATHYVFF